MQKVETYQAIVTQTRVIETTCDWCGVDIKQAGHYDIREFTLEFAQGEAYSCGGSKEGWQVEDLCDGCIDKLRDLLESNGVRVSVLEVDW